MRELISHPPQGQFIPLLQEHLRVVGDYCYSILQRQSFNSAFPQDELALAGFVVGVCHDFGKAKREFQDYIWEGQRKGSSDHSLISSLFTFLIAKEIFGNRKQPSRLLSFICAYAVNRHHGLLVNPEEAFSSHNLEREFRIAKQSLDEQIWSFKFAPPDHTFSLDFREYQERFLKCSPESISKLWREFARRLRHKARGPQIMDAWLPDLYFVLLLIISALTEADRASVIGIPLPKAFGKVNAESIRRYASSRPEAPPIFQILRQKAWGETESFINQDFSKTVRLTLPTGMGKTLLGLYLAAKALQEANGPIIYALPYLSIIEQTTEVARFIFPSDSSDIRVIQHHSLSFPQEKHEEEKHDFEQARFSLESWDAELVVTTFDQLFYSFLSPDRGFVRRFFQLPGSVLILDEIQTLPGRLIPAVQNLLQKASEILGTRIIYMTATHPPFLKEAQPVMKHDAHYFKPLRRTKLILNIKQPIPFSQYLHGLAKWLQRRRGRSILFVSNTIRCSLRLFDHLLTLKEEEDFKELKLFYLSGNIAPVHRLKRIAEIKQALSSEPRPWLVVISTQCVEAGVDIDMDEVVRDFAPWDSIMQVCGRANRFGSREEATVWLYRWEDDFSERSGEFHRYIYDCILTDTTLEILSEYETIGEKDYFCLQEQYAHRLEERLSPENSQELLEKALSWQFDELDFEKLFRDQGWKVSLFCVADQTAKKLKDIAVLMWEAKDFRKALRELQNLCEDHSLFEPLVQFLRITPRSLKGYIADIQKQDDRRIRFQLPRLLGPMLQAYTISIPVRSLEGLRERVSYISSKERILPYIPREYYDPLRGFSPDKTDKEMLSNII